MGDFAAVLWDLDGTLIDSEPLWMAGEHELADSHGAVWTEEDGLNLVGNSLIESGHYIKKRLGSDLSAEDIVDILVARLANDLSREIPWRPGAVELFTALDQAMVPQALVTMSYAAIAAPVAAALSFAATVTGDQVTNGKPHPEPYLRAAELLGVDAADCLAIEDSGTGATSANAAGCHVLVVPHFVNVPDAPRRTQRASLEQLRPDGLRDLF
jgi:HAD superfamily hydrolase (TIGR01509 family)